MHILEEFLVEKQLKQCDQGSHANAETLNVCLSIGCTEKDTALLLKGFLLKVNNLKLTVEKYRRIQS